MVGAAVALGFSVESGADVESGEPAVCGAEEATVAAGADDPVVSVPPQAAASSNSEIARSRVRIGPMYRRLDAIVTI